MKTKLDQISIPPLCSGMSEMAHTLVGKAVPLQLKGHGFKHQRGQSAGLKEGQNQNWLPHPCLLGGPQVGGNATSPLNSRGSPTKGTKSKHEKHKKNQNKNFSMVSLIQPIVWGPLRIQG